MKRPRHLSPEERALWDRVASTATRIARPAIPATEPIKPKVRKSTPASRNHDFPDFNIGDKADISRPHDLLPGLGARLASAPVNMDAKSFEKLKRGKLKPEGRIDLHGMTIAEAYPDLQNFILMSHAAGKRLVLVITGKGKDRDDGGPIPTRIGVLRHQVPQWLALPPLRAVVLQVAPAHLRHGGQGAYYVYLRKSR